MEVIAYLNFLGQCKAAFEFYARTFGGEIVGMVTYGDTPTGESTPAEQKGLIANVRMKVGKSELMGSDCPPEYFKPTAGTSISLMIEDPSEAERIFNALAEGGQVSMPFGQTFWAHRFGMATDRFGIPWMVNCEKAA